MMATEAKLFPVKDLPLGEVRTVRIEDRLIAVFHQPEGIFAIDNLCPHQDAHLHEGWVMNGVVTCPLHQWQFRLKDGQGVSFGGRGPCVQTFEVEERDGMLWIQLGE